MQKGEDDEELIEEKCRHRSHNNRDHDKGDIKCRDKQNKALSFETVEAIHMEKSNGNTGWASSQKVCLATACRAREAHTWQYWRLQLSPSAEPRWPIIDE